MPYDTFTASLEVVAAACEDVVPPVYAALFERPPVYAALFERFPEMEALFELDTDHGVRGHMLNEALTMAEGLLSGDTIAPSFIAAERMSHDGYGVDAATFGAFYGVMRDVFAQLAGPAWTPEMTAAWDEVIARAAIAD